MDSVDARKHVLDGGPEPPCEWEIFTGKDITGHARSHTAVSCAKMAEWTEVSFRLWGQVG